LSDFSEREKSDKMLSPLQAAAFAAKGTPTLPINISVLANKDFPRERDGRLDMFSLSENMPKNSVAL
jgi:hypothetical protein